MGTRGWGGIAGVNNQSGRGGERGFLEEGTIKQRPKG